MAKRTKRTKTAQKPRASTKPETATSSVAITKPDYDALMVKLMASDSAAASEKLSAMGILDKAEKTQHAHKGAIAWCKKLRKLSPAKRAEHLFHFHVCCGHEGWPEDTLPLGDRERDPADPRDPAEVQAEAEAHALRRHMEQQAERVQTFTGNGPVDPPDDDDLRPRFLRTGSAADPNPPAELMEANAKPH